jgi:polyribonucleotide nucleotidyltransferase
MSGAREDLDYFPLQVEYQEKLYAGGKIKGSRWVKREGRPTDESILTGRLIDRSIRPLFPKGFKNEVQVVVTTLSVDGNNPVDMLAMYAVSAALHASSVPWEGPIGGIRVGQDRTTGELIINPTFEMLQTTSQMDLFISATKDNILMVEAGADEVSEDTLIKAFAKAQEIITVSIEGIEEFATKVGAKKIDFVPSEIDKEIVTAVTKEIGDSIGEIVRQKALNIKDGEKALMTKLNETFAEKYAKKDIAAIVEDLVKAEARRQTIETEVRSDGRKLTEIRNIWTEVGVLPRTHGSAIFTRGMTQALTITTLASPAHEQIIEGAEGEETKRYIHHYNMPPYTVGETGRIGFTGRREIGHGALAERALEPMIPSEEVFPYTIRVVSEIMSSNGSTSMASVCGSTLSLMDAGVPLKKPVAGIAMGLMKEGSKYKVLSDIMGFEDHTGDMDFKVAGTKDGVTAMQMDVKIKGIPFDVLKQALNQALEGRLFILGKMLESIQEPRPALSQYAPKISIVKVPVDRIGEIIGPGGKMIKNIIAESGAEVDINDEGMVFITATDEASRQKATSMVEGIIKVIAAGEEYDGTVARITDFGAFVTLLPGKDGLVHVSQMAVGRVNHPSDVMSEGDTVHVRVREIDDMGRVSLTMLTPEQEAEAKASRPPERPRTGGFSRDNRGGGDRGRDRGGYNRGPRR